MTPFFFGEIFLRVCCRHTKIVKTKTIIDSSFSRWEHPRFLPRAAPFEDVPASSTAAAGNFTWSILRHPGRIIDSSGSAVGYVGNSAVRRTTSRGVGGGGRWRTRTKFKHMHGAGGRNEVNAYICVLKHFDSEDFHSRKKKLQEFIVSPGNFFDG